MNVVIAWTDARTRSGKIILYDSEAAGSVTEGVFVYL
jgi:hypothetical protein